MLEPADTVSIFQKESEKPRQFIPGEIIFEEGQMGELMYGISEGEVELCLNGKVLETIKAGDIFGEGALVHNPGVRATTAIAKTHCTLVFIDQKRFLFALQNTPMFAVEVIKSLSDRLRRLKRAL